MTVYTAGSFPFSAPQRTVKRVFIHCSASDNPKHDDISIIAKWHLERRFAGIGYHFYITRLGIIQCGRPLEEIPAAQEGYNTGSIAICLGGDKKFTKAQFKSLRELCDAIHEALPMATYHAHSEVNRYKTCPNFDVKKVLGLDAKGRLT